ncbi:hypothetical protein LSTR_LSTR005077 [Laodelphax striatellus]|uniref:Kinesin motor domain-containing protein n=1 Tax=Laodelphax striatellus TaxID=195883 RepID=A0A482WT85_LAOST|nr:hypothetical protein LSTR_LSTR005077 [Laodelphax striatellus]
MEPPTNSCATTSTDTGTDSQTAPQLPCSSGAAALPPPAATPCSFTEALKRSPPTIPASLLRRLAFTQQIGIGKVKVMLKVANVDENEASSPYISVDSKRKQVTVFDSACPPSPFTDDRRQRVSAPKVFAFDAIFTSSDTQAEISSSTIGDVVHAVINGTDGCIFSFSHAKLDKSQTMLGNSEGCGLIATAITWLYKGVSEHRQRTKARFGIRVSALELTNRRRDLLASYASVSGEEIDCDSITEVRAGSFQQAAACLDAALKHRQHTDSHLVVTLHLYRHSETGPASRSRLHLIDLGGGVNVEQKLGRTEMILPPSAVGNILLAILNGHKHLPHRDQIVTQTLKQCLGSLRCQAVIIAHISTAKMHQTDTIATVQLASRIHRLRRRRFKVSHPSQADDPERSPVETVDPSSSEQSADTVIYVGPGETETDGEHPPIYMSRLLPGSPQRSISKNSSRSTKSSPCKSKSKPLLDGGEEQWVDGPKISKSRLVEARNQLLAKDKRGGQKEMWVDGPASNLMDFSKRSMIRKWVENQTMQTQSRRRDKDKGKYKEMTVFKTCEDRGRASGQEDSAEDEQPVTATATETPAAQRNAEIGKVVPIQRLQAIGQDMPEPDKPNNDNHELELDNGDELDEKSDTSSDQKEVMLDIDEDIITDEDDEIIIVEEPMELVPMQDCCLQVTEEDIALSMGEYIENPLPEVDQEDHPLKLLSEDNLSVMSSLGDQGRLERWQSLSDLCPPEDDTASILSEPLYYSDGVYCQNCRLNITPSRNHVHLNSLNRLSKSISLLRHPDGSSNPNLSKLDDGWNKTNEQDIDQDNKFKDEFDALSIPPLPPLQSTMISLSSTGFKCSGRTTKPFFRQMNHSGNIHDPGGRDWQCKRLQQLRQEQRHLIQQIEAANKQLNNSVKQDSMTPTWMIRKYSMHESWMGRDRAS